MPSSPSLIGSHKGFPSGAKIIEKPPPGLYTKGSACSNIRGRSTRGPHRLRDRISRKVILLKVLFRQYLRRHKDEALPLDGHELARPITGLAGLVVEPCDLLGIGHLELSRPAPYDCVSLISLNDRRGVDIRHMDLDPLRVFVVAEEGLQVLPAVQAPNFTEWGRHHARQRLRLPFAPDRSLDVCRLNFPSVEYDLACR